MPRIRILILPAIGLIVCMSATAARAEDQPAAATPMPMPGHDAMAPPPPSASGRTPAPAGVYCYIGWPNDGEVIRSTKFRVWFGLRGMGVAPAGTDKANTGHHHLLVDTALPPLDKPIPNDKTHLHFGLGQTETVLELPPGTHTLQLLLGDANHFAFDPPVMSAKITIYVRP
jgi:hypothetical protein